MINRNIHTFDRSANYSSNHCSSMWVHLLSWFFFALLSYLVSVLFLYIYIYIYLLWIPSICFSDRQQLIVVRRRWVDLCILSEKTYFDCKTRERTWECLIRSIFEDKYKLCVLGKNERDIRGKDLFLMVVIIFSSWQRSICFCWYYWIPLAMVDYR
jgi:hypothetical protein